MKKTEDEYIKNELLESTYLFCYKRLGNSHDAEDLTQEIMLEAVKALRSGRKIENFYAWFWAMARNRVNLFFRMKRFHAAELELSDAVSDNGERVEDALILEEEISELNRSISRLSRLHREVIILYYLREMKISAIAQTLGVPENTVKGRLHDARDEIRKGMNEMNGNTGRSSYAPADVQLWGGYGIPSYWNSISDLMTKQIFAACAKEAKTLRQIADEIGVAPVYFEEKLRYLLDKKFIKESSGGKYLTDFIVYPAQVHADLRAELSEIYDPLGKEATALLRSCEEQIRAVGFYGSDLPFGTLLWLLYYFAAGAMMDAMEAANAARWEGKVPENNGKSYRIAGTVAYPDEEITMRGKRNSVPWSNFHRQFQTSGYRWVEHANLFQMSPFEERYDILNESNADLFMRIFDDPFLKLTPYEEETAANLIRLDYLHKKDGGLFLSVPVMTYGQQSQISEILRKAFEPLSERYLDRVVGAADRIVLPHIRKDLLEEYAHWTLPEGFFPISYLMYYGMYSDEKPLDIPEDYSKSSKGICIYIKK